MSRVPGSPTEKLEFLKGIDAQTLPYLIGDILYFIHNHKQVRVVDGPGDGRRDIHSVLSNGEKHIAQCKYHRRYKSTVSSREADELVIALIKFGVTAGLFATTARISPQAKREYLDNFPDFNMSFMDGVDIVDTVLSSPILSSAWMEGESFNLTKNSLKVPFIIRNSEHDYPIEDLDFPEKQLGKLNISFGKDCVCKEAFRPYRKPDNITFSEDGTYLISCYKAVVSGSFSLSEIPEILSEISRLVGVTIHRSVNKTNIFRLGIPSLNRIANREKIDDEKNQDSIPLPFIAPKSYVLSREGSLVLEKDWILVNAQSKDWHFPENISCSGVFWAGWYSEYFDCMLMLQLTYPRSNELNYLYHAHQDLKIRSLESSLYLVATTDVCNEFLNSLEPQQHPNLELSYGIGGKMLAWIHPKILSESAAIEPIPGKYEYFEDDEIIAFKSSILTISEKSRNYSLKKISFSQARHIAAIEDYELLPEIKYTTMRSADLFHYFDEVSSPSNLREREATFVWMWNIEASLPQVSEFIKNPVSIPCDADLFLDVKLGFSTKKTFLLSSLTFSIPVSLSTDDFLVEQKENLEKGFETLRHWIESTWKNSACSTKYFWNKEVGFCL
jgi:hypothetical protein